MTEESNDTKTCPFCAETIKAAAIVCKHCGRDLPTAASADESLMLRHGIVYKDERYIWRGNYFKALDEAVAFVKRTAPDSIVGTTAPGPVEATDSGGFPIFKIIGVCVVAVVGLVLVLGATQSEADKEKFAARRAIELCWKDHDRKSLDPETKRFVAGACEMAEKKFVEKYGVNP